MPRLPIARVAVMLLAIAPAAMAQFSPRPLGYFTDTRLIALESATASRDAFWASNQVMRTWMTNTAEILNWAGPAGVVSQSVAGVWYVGTNQTGGSSSPFVRSFGIWGVEGVDTIGVLRHRVFRSAGLWEIDASQFLVPVLSMIEDEFWETNTLGHVVPRSIL